MSGVRPTIDLARDPAVDSIANAPAAGMRRRPSLIH